MLKWGNNIILHQPQCEKAFMCPHVATKGGDDEKKKIPNQEEIFSHFLFFSPKIKMKKK